MAARVARGRWRRAPQGVRAGGGRWGGDEDRREEERRRARDAERAREAAARHAAPQASSVHWSSQQLSLRERYKAVQGGVR